MVRNMRRKDEERKVRKEKKKEVGKIGKREKIMCKIKVGEEGRTERVMGETWGTRGERMGRGR